VEQRVAGCYTLQSGPWQIDARFTERMSRSTVPAARRDQNPAYGGSTCRAEGEANEVADIGENDGRLVRV
jgi:hypothetical protein